MKKSNFILAALAFGAIIAFNPMVTHAAECQHIHTKTVTVGSAGYNDTYHWTAGSEKICKDCGKHLSALGGAIATHSITSSFAKAPTCLSDGYEEYGCDDCEYHVRKIVGKATHDISDCDVLFQNGSVIVRDSLADENVPKANYNVRYDGNEFTITGTNGFTGTLKAKCSHENTNVKYFGQPGYNSTQHWGVNKGKVCADCGEMLSVVGGAMLPHELKTVQRIAPTCIHNGKEVKSCSCGYKITSNLPATHNISNCKAILNKNNTIKVADGGTIVNATYYSVSKAKGVATITGKNGYKGTLKCKIAMTPIFTNVKVKKASANTKVKITWRNLVQSGYRVAYKADNVSNYKIVTVKNNFYTFAVNMKAKKVKVKVRGFQTVNGKKIFSSWNNLKTIRLK